MYLSRDDYSPRVIVKGKIMANAATESGSLQGEFHIVETKVIQALPNGVKVQILDTGGRGFVPRREISWERSIRVPLTFPKPGEKRKAVVLDTEGKNLRLSFRRVRDPWIDAIREKRYKKGDIVVGEVVNVRHNAAYIQLEPGIDAILYPREASFSKKSIEDVVWVGDKIRALVVESDLPGRRIEVSIVRALSKVQGESQNDLRNKFYYLPPSEREKIAKTSFLTRKREESVYSPRQMRVIKRVLLVDDEEGWRELLKKQIEERHYQSRVDVVTNSDDAWEKIEEGILYDIIIIDIQLGGEDGRDFAREIRNSGIRVPILLTSVSPQDITDIQKKFENISFAPKTETLEELFEAIDIIRLGESIFTKNLTASFLSESGSAKLAAEVSASQKSLQNILEKKEKHQFQEK